MLKAIMASRAFPTARDHYPPTVHHCSEAQGARKQGQVAQGSQVKRKALTMAIDGCHILKACSYSNSPLSTIASLAISSQLEINRLSRPWPVD